MAKLKQINLRLTDESEARLEALTLRMRAALGMNISKSDVLNAGLLALEEKYPPTEKGDGKPTKKPKAE